MHTYAYCVVQIIKYGPPIALVLCGVYYFVMTRKIKKTMRTKK